MRNLKKVLSLVLALAMALSLMTVALAADKSDFADADEITYTEAVDVLQALGILGGDDSGNFNPTGVLTREGAAKIICYLLMGSTAADNLSTTTAPFNDVPANRWSAGYIAYCKTMGIIGGDGTGNFNPNGEINAYGFAKMLLVALGYDANIEKFGGNDWTINVARLANTNGLFDGNNSVVGTQTLTREEASLYALNALKADMVEYTNKGTVITQPDGSEIVLNPSAATKVANSASKDYAGRTTGDDKDEVMQLCELYFSDLKLGTSTDNFGRPANQWKLGSETIGTYAKGADLTYTAAVKGSDLYSDLGRPTLESGAVEYFTYANPEGTTTAPVSGFDIKSGNDKKLGGNGVLVEVYKSEANGKTTVDVVIIETQVGTVDAVNEATRNDPATVTVNGMKYETTAYNEDDVVLYTVAKVDGKSEIQSMSLADYVSGQVTSINNDKDGNKESVVVNGTTYKLAAAFDPSDVTLTAGSEYDLFLDNYGYVIKVEETSATTSRYAVVLATKTGEWNEGNGGSGQVDQARLVLADGTVVEAKVKIDSSLTASDFKPGVLVRYTERNGTYTIREISNKTASATKDEIKTGQSELTSGVYANNSTVFIVRSGEGNDATYSAYVGINNIPDISIDSGKKFSYIADSKNASIATLVYVADGSAQSEDEMSIYILAPYKSSTVDADDNEIYTYNAVVDGAVSTIQSTESNLQSGAYKSIVKDSDGYVTDVKKVDADKQKTITSGNVKTVSNGVVTFSDNSSYGYVDDVDVFVIDGSDINGSSLRALRDTTSNNSGTKYHITLVLNDKGSITAVYATVIK